MFCYIPTARLPMQFISMGQTGPFDPSSSGYHYALTVICMLTGFTFCVHLKTETAPEVLLAFVDDVYAKTGGSLKILSENGT